MFCIPTAYALLPLLNKLVNGHQINLKNEHLGSDIYDRVYDAVIPRTFTPCHFLSSVF